MIHAIELLERVLTIGGGYDGVALLFQRVAHRFTKLFFVFDQKHGVIHRLVTNLYCDLCVGGVRGRVTRNVVPSVELERAASSLPPCAPTICREMSPKTPACSYGVRVVDRTAVVLSY